MTQNDLSSMSGTQDALSSVGSEIANTSPPLTARDVAKYLRNDWHWEQIHPLFLGPKHYSPADAIEAYTAQQTAAKDARIAELEAENERIGGLLEEWGGKYHRLLTERDALQAKLDAIDVREYIRLIGENERLKAKLDDAQAYKAELLKPYQWQSIETAPKDGTPFVAFQHIVEDINDVDNYWICDWHEGAWSGGCPNPTHWRPLLPPPEATEEHNVS